MSMYLIYDTETTGLPRDWNAPLTDSDNWPRLVQLAWQLHDAKGNLVNTGNLIVYPDGFNIPYTAAKVHGITTERAQEEGIALNKVIDEFLIDLEKCEYVVGHNIGFDILDQISENYEVKFESRRFGDIIKLKKGGKSLIFLKPNTFMNLSGKAVK